MSLAHKMMMADDRDDARGDGVESKESVGLPNAVSRRASAAAAATAAAALPASKERMKRLVVRSTAFENALHMSGALSGAAPKTQSSYKALNTEEIEELRADLKIPTRKEALKVEKVAKEKVREICLFMVFVGLFTFTTLLRRNDQELYFFTESVRNQLTGVEFPWKFVPNTAKTFNDAATVEEFYQWMEGPFYSALWTASTFDGDHTYRADDIPASSLISPNRAGFIMGQNRLFGGVRIGWTRAREVACSTPGQIVVDEDDRWLQCPKTVFESRGEFLDTPIGHPLPVPNTFSIEDTLDEPEVTSPTTSDAYFAPKQWIVLPNLESNGTVAKTLRHMVENKFVDRLTRVITIDLTVYNPKLDYFLVTRLFAELPIAGGVLTTAKFVALRLYRFYEPWDFIRFLAEVVVQGIVMFYTWEVIAQCKKRGIKKVLMSMDNAPHNLNLGLFYVALIFKLLAFAVRPSTVDPTSDDFVNFRHTANFLELAQDCNAFNAFLTWVKVTKYLTFIPKFKILIGTLQAASEEVRAFGIICAFVLFGSSQAFALAFGTNSYKYRNLTQAFFTLMRALLGDFDFEELRIHKPFLGPLMFFIFVMLAVFVLLNMFIAIIGDAFNDTKTALAAPDQVAQAKRLQKAVVNVAFSWMFRLPHVGKLLHRRFNMIDGNDLKEGHVNVRNLYTLLDRNAHEKGWEEYISEVLKRMESSHTTSTREIAAALVEMGAGREDAEALALQIDENRDNKVSVTELDAIMSKWEHSFRSGRSGRWLPEFRKSTSRDVTSTGGDSATNAGASARVVPADGAAAVDMYSSKKAHRFDSGSNVESGHFATALVETSRHAAAPESTSSASTNFSFTTVKKAFNHLRLVVLISSWRSDVYAGRIETDDAKALLMVARRREAQLEIEDTAAAQAALLQQDTEQSEMLTTLLTTMETMRSDQAAMMAKLEEFMKR